MTTIYLIRHGQASFGAESYDKLSPNDAIRFLGESFMHYLWSRRAGPVLDLMLDLASRVPMYSVSQGYCNRAAQPYWDNPL